MGASFRNIGEIQSLAGCDRLTISPALLQQLSEDNAPLTRQLNDSAKETLLPVTAISESQWRYDVNADAMATEKLSQGIRQFAIDQEKLESILSELV